ncbi:TetR/AcrR family transcriptional regulator [Hyphomonadaceae bacterium BL14]|nr:TetR/AcrR family transcriptional regulator [Hyphomonadaceae bacterium BL14]
MAATAARADRGVSDRKTELLHILARTAVADRSAPVSLRQFAIRAGVSEPTLRHYFNDRQGVVIAIIALFADGARDWLERCAQPQKSLEAAVSGYGDMALEGADTDQFAQAHAFALVESIHDPLVARAYLDTIIEPSLRAIESRLAPSLDPEGTRGDAVRHAALALYAPVLIAVLHQRLLKGDAARPLDMGVFFSDLTQLFAHGLKQPD